MGVIEKIERKIEKKRPAADVPLNGKAAWVARTTQASRVQAVAPFPHQLSTINHQLTATARLLSTLLKR